MRDGGVADVLMAVDKRSSRLGVLAVVAVLLLGVLGTRLWFLQGTQQAEYQAQGDRVEDARRLRPARARPDLRRQGPDPRRQPPGDDDRHRLVARSARRRTATRCSSGCRVRCRSPVDELQQRYDPCYGAPAIPKCNKGQIYSPLLPLPLKEDVDQETVNFLLERSEDYPGISVQEQWKRVYPYAPLASHVVGYMGAITEGTFDEYRAEGYNADERVGQFGVEKSMESVLHGSWGKKVYEIDAAGNIVGEDFDRRSTRSPARTCS